MGEQDGRQHLERDREHLRRDAVAGLLLGDHVVLPGRRALPAVLGWPRATGPARRRTAPVAIRRSGERLVLTSPVLVDGGGGDDVDRREVVVAPLRRRVLVEPRAGLGAEVDRPRHRPAPRAVTERDPEDVEGVVPGDPPDRLVGQPGQRVGHEVDGLAGALGVRPVRAGQQTIHPDVLEQRSHVVLPERRDPHVLAEHPPRGWCSK